MIAAWDALRSLGGGTCPLWSRHWHYIVTAIVIKREETDRKGQRQLDYFTSDKSYEDFVCIYSLLCDAR